MGRRMQTLAVKTTYAPHHIRWKYARPLSFARVSFAATAAKRERGRHVGWLDAPLRSWKRLSSLALLSSQKSFRALARHHLASITSEVCDW